MNCGRVRFPDSMEQCPPRKWMNARFPKILGAHRARKNPILQSPRSWTPLLPLEISVVSNLCESVCNIDREGGREGGDWRKLGNDRLKGVFAVVELDPGVEF